MILQQGFPANPVISVLRFCPGRRGRRTDRKRGDVRSRDNGGEPAADTHNRPSKQMMHVFRVHSGMCCGISAPSKMMVIRPSSPISRVPSLPARSISHRIMPLSRLSSESFEFGGCVNRYVCTHHANIRCQRNTHSSSLVELMMPNVQIQCSMPLHQVP